MPPRKSAAGGSSSTKDEIQVSKSPAEFFAENQSIAGFDNPVSFFTSSHLSNYMHLLKHACCCHFFVEYFSDSLLLLPQHYV